MGEEFLAVVGVWRRRLLIGLVVLALAVAAAVLVSKLKLSGGGPEDAWHGQPGGAP